ncbi:energy transducer TonB [Affinibrenneria salicis]|uniref:Protein TonB n=1 Tax=Affinibrenneria salicis TaxID=2590031 RepID=A0A5J5FXP2_9GAMM|nr:energy transducer TonB [Affinibrenneria salicis]KAA8998855.1 energy transducer TonB [Affinibrenneria salicis]
MSTCDYAGDVMNVPSVWPRRIAAAATALAAHLLLATLLLQHWQINAPPAPVVRHLNTTLITLPAAQPIVAPAPTAEPAPEAAPEPAPLQTPPPTTSEPPAVTPPRPDKAQLARQQQARERKEEQTRRRQQEKQRQQQQDLAQQRAADEQRRQAALQHQAAERAAQNARQAAEMTGRQYQPISKQTPDYPEKALSRKIEGDCTVVYRVNRRGEVENPQAESDCNPLFVRPSLSAARTFRYQPRIINGQPVDVPQVKNTFHYRIQ